jgi:glutaredoxin-related protein
LLEKSDPSRQEIEAIISEDPVVVFGTPAAAKKTKDVRELFEKRKVYPVMNYLDRTNKGKAMHDALVKMSDKRGQPNLFIFIGGKHIGGKVDMKMAAESGQLKTMLDSAGVSHHF